MIKVSDEEIKEIIKKKNDKIEFISSKMIVKDNKHRRLVTMKCECGEIFNFTLDKLKSNKHLMCNKCSKKMQLKASKKHYNKKYRPMIEQYGYELVNQNEDLYANKYVEVIEKETGYRGYVYPNQPRKILVFSLLHNKNNYIYNINKYAENIGIGTRAVDFYNSEKWTNQGIEFICECGEKFYTTDRAFIKGKFFCDKCTKRYSSNEIEFENYLKQQKIEYISQFTINSLRDVNPLHFDFYLKDYNCFVEIDGEHHNKVVNFGGNLTEEQMVKRFEVYRKHDKMKEDYCHKYNIPLLRINYTDIKNKKYKTILSDFIQTVQD